MNKEAFEVLTKTKEILSDEDSWSRVGLIQSKDFVTGEGEVRYCLLGALGKAKGFNDSQLKYNSQMIYDASKNSDGSGKILAQAIVEYVTFNELQVLSETEIAEIERDPSTSWFINDADDSSFELIHEVLDLAIEKAENE